MLYSGVCDATIWLTFFALPAAAASVVVQQVYGHALVVLPGSAAVLEFAVIASQLGAQLASISAATLR